LPTKQNAKLDGTEPFELADRGVDFYKTNNCTKSVAVNPVTFVHQDHNDKAAHRLSMRSTAVLCGTIYRAVLCCRQTLSANEDY
jgi:hypothetical protein